jgi:hypothetical protein
MVRRDLEELDFKEDLVLICGWEIELFIVALANLFSQEKTKVHSESFFLEHSSENASQMQLLNQ